MAHATGRNLFVNKTQDLLLKNSLEGNIKDVWISPKWFKKQSRKNADSFNVSQTHCILISSVDLKFPQVILMHI